MLEKLRPIWKLSTFPKHKGKSNCYIRRYEGYSIFKILVKHEHIRVLWSEKKTKIKFDGRAKTKVGYVLQENTLISSSKWSNLGGYSKKKCIYIITFLQLICDSIMMFILIPFLITKFNTDKVDNRWDIKQIPRILLIKINHLISN